MDNNSEVRKIVKELYEEFLEEEKNLCDIRDSHMVRIDELDQRIINYKKNDDVDFKVFSPRNNININSDKINELEREKKELESECNSSTKQIRYYSEKLVKLEKILDLLNARVDNNNIFVFENEDDTVNEDIKEDSIFNELFPKAKESNNNINDEIINVNEENNNPPKENVFSNIQTSDNNDQIITPGSIARIVHKAEFTEKIMSNDSIRAKLELKEIIKMLKELIK